MNLNTHVPNWVLLVVMASILIAGSVLGFVLKVYLVGTLFAIPASLMMWTAIKDCTKAMTKNST